VIPYMAASVGELPLPPTSISGPWVAADSVWFLPSVNLQVGIPSFSEYLCCERLPSLLHAKLDPRTRSSFAGSITTQTSSVFSGKFIERLIREKLQRGRQFRWVRAPALQQLRTELISFLPLASNTGLRSKPPPRPSVWVLVVLPPRSKLFQDLPQLFSLQPVRIFREPVGSLFQKKPFSRPH